jgi:hypothetical protein
VAQEDAAKERAQGPATPPPRRRASGAA